MSYILDALKKAEQERKLGKSPDFMDNHSRTPRQPRKRIGAYALLIVLIAIAGSFGWWFGHEEPSDNKLPFQSSGVKTAPVAQATKTEQPPALPAAPAVEPPAAVGQKTPAPAQKTEAPKEARPPVKAAEPKKPVKEPADAKTQQTDGEAENKPDPKKIYSYDELPDEIKKGLPPLAISTHMYSAERADRLVSINGNIGREKQNLMPGVSLESITPTGAIVKHKGYKIKVDLR
jgi:general secretion pathway protein B